MNPTLKPCRKYCRICGLYVGHWKGCPNAVAKNRGDAEALEAAEIRKYQPRYNTANK